MLSIFRHDLCLIYMCMCFPHSLEQIIIYKTEISLRSITYYVRQNTTLTFNSKHFFSYQQGVLFSTPGHIKSVCGHQFGDPCSILQLNSKLPNQGMQGVLRKYTENVFEKIEVHLEVVEIEGRLLIITSDNVRQITVFQGTCPLSYRF